MTHVELDVLKEPIGEQDQYIVAHGKIPCFEFKLGERVKVQPLRISEGPSST